MSVLFLSRQTDTHRGHIRLFPLRTCIPALAKARSCHPFSSIPASSGERDPNRVKCSVRRLLAVSVTSISLSFITAKIRKMDLISASIGLPGVYFYRCCTCPPAGATGSNKLSPCSFKHNEEWRNKSERRGLKQWRPGDQLTARVPDRRRLSIPNELAPRFGVLFWRLSSASSRESFMFLEYNSSPGLGCLGNCGAASGSILGGSRLHEVILFSGYALDRLPNLQEPPTCHHAPPRCPCFILGFAACEPNVVRRLFPGCPGYPMPMHSFKYPCPDLLTRQLECLPSYCPGCDVPGFLRRRKAGPNAGDSAGPPRRCTAFCYGLECGESTGSGNAWKRQRTAIKGAQKYRPGDRTCVAHHVEMTTSARPPSRTDVCSGKTLRGSNLVVGTSRTYAN
ncbi:hypothetical protein C8R47DRAFT_1285543 [Mycena vitilis]|nr:hypothetical protein C8R47DRAFT_1285543 [Mycena vitilis]